MYQSEIEFKFFPSNPQKILENCEKFAKLLQPRTLFRSLQYNREDNPSFRDVDIVRLRNEGENIFLTIKQRYKDGVRLDHALEKECIVDNFEIVAEMFEHIGCIGARGQEKYRTKWVLEDCEIVYDENPWLEPYFEIEGPTEDAIRGVAELLGLDFSERDTITSGGVYRRKYGDEAYKNVRKIMFAANPFV